MLMKGCHFDAAKLQIIVTCGVFQWSQSGFICSKSTIETLEGLKSQIEKMDTRTTSIDVVLWWCHCKL